MKGIAKLTEMMNDPTVVKTMSTISKEGVLHSVVIGGIAAVDNDTIVVAEVLLKTTSANLSDNKKVAFLTVKGMEAYLINATAQERLTEGPYFDLFNEKVKANKLVLKAVWTFSVDEIYDEGGNPQTAGTKVF